MTEQSNYEFSQQIKAEAEALYPQLVAWRRDFHQHPELGFREVRTAGVVAEHLQDLGLEVSTGVGKTGVVAIVEGDEPLNDDAPTVMLRFDMDALPIHEITDSDYQSQTPGVMHACGHDGHTAIGMGVAQLLTQNRSALKGRVKLVFQPAEEGDGGALAMIADQVLENPKPDAAFGLHLWSQLPLNQVVVQAGPLMAGAGMFELIVRGKGGHGALPHETIDATLIASQILVAWQSIVSRNVAPTDTAVVTVGSFHSGNAANVISEEAILSGTIRAYKQEVYDFLVKRMKEIATGICQAFGATYELSWSISVPAVINTEAEAAFMHEVANRIVDEDQIVQITPEMVAEDMAEFLQHVPGCFIWVGAWDTAGDMPAPHHNPAFDFDERMMPTGAAILADAAISFLGSR
ncbi:MAG: amidohydrolase [Chloroflexota bacterium]